MVLTSRNIFPLIAHLGGLIGAVLPICTVKDGIDIRLNIHGYDDFQRAANSIGSGVMVLFGQVGGGGNKPRGRQAAGGDIRPGGSAIVGEHGIEHLRVGYDGTVTVTPVNE